MVHSFNIVNDSIHRNLSNKCYLIYEPSHSRQAVRLY